MNMIITNETTDDRGFQLRTALFEGFEIQQLRSPRAGADAEFVPARVVFEGREVWSFAKDHKSQGFAGMAFLREVGDELVIMLATKRDLCEIIPVHDLAHRQRVGGEVIGGRKLKDIVVLKELLAKVERLNPIWSLREEKMRTAISQALTATREAAMKAEAEAAERERAQRLAERDAKRAEITGRKRIYAQTLSGDRRHGYPVVGDEWLILGDGIFCISVTSYNSETGTIGELIESFVVKKNGAKKVRQGVVAVTKEPSPASQAKAAAPALSFKMVPVKGELEEVILVANMDDIRTLRDQGLNSGTLVMCPKTGDENRFSIFSIRAGKIEPITEVMRKL